MREKWKKKRSRRLRRKRRKMRARSSACGGYALWKPTHHLAQSNGQLNCQVRGLRCRRISEAGGRLLHTYFPVRRDGCLDRITLLHALYVPQQHSRLSSRVGEVNWSKYFVSRMTTPWCICCGPCFLREARCERSRCVEHFWFHFARLQRVFVFVLHL